MIVTENALEKHAICCMLLFQSDTIKRTFLIEVTHDRHVKTCSQTENWWLGSIIHWLAPYSKISLIDVSGATCRDQPLEARWAMLWMTASWWALLTGLHVFRPAEFCPSQSFWWLLPSGFVTKERFESRDHLFRRWNKKWFEQKYFINTVSSNIQCGRGKQLISNIR